MEGGAHDALGHGRLGLVAKCAHLKILEGGAHDDTLGNGRLGPLWQNSLTLK